MINKILHNYNSGLSTVYTSKRGVKCGTGSGKGQNTRTWGDYKRLVKGGKVGVRL